MHDLWIKIIFTSGAKIYNQLLGVLLLIITARVLGAEGRGELVVITTWVTTFSTITYLSLGQVVMHRAANTDGNKWLPEAYHFLLSYAGISTIVCWIVALAIQFSTYQVLYGKITPTFLLVGLLLIPFKIWESYSSSMLQALERLDIHNRNQILGGTVGFLSAMVLLILLDAGLLSIIIGIILSQFIIAAGGITLIHRMANGFSLPSRTTIEYYLINGLKLHINAISGFIISGSDVLMLSYYRGLDETAFYQMAVQLMGLPLLIPYAANMVIYGKVSSMGANGAWEFNRKLLMQVTLFVVGISIAAGGTAQWWIPLIFGEVFNQSVEIFRWLLVACVGMTFSTIMAPQWIGRGLFMMTSVLAIIVACVNLVLNWMLIPEYGMYGAAGATLVAYSISIVINGLMLIYCNNQHKIYKS